MVKLANQLSKEEALKRLHAEPFKRQTVSFYRYVPLTKVNELRDQLYLEWSELGVFGRIYVAEEGINAQISVPVPRWEDFLKNLESRTEFKDMPLKLSLEEGDSFWKLAIKVKKQIVADGLTPNDYDLSNIGTHLSPEEFNKALEEPDTVVVDMRNHYESRIGRFEGAVCPDTDTFKEELQVTKELLKGHEDKKVLLYCTGGIRCEKASAYLKHYGFKDVNQLHGGIIAYAHDVRQKRLPSRFKGVNYVFDGRTDERVTDDVLSTCDQCEASCDTFVNCKNVMCNLLFIQCSSCTKSMEQCCGEECKKIIHLSIEEQRALRKKEKPSTFEKYRKRIRPKLKI